MVKHTKNDVAISDQIDQEIKAVLRDKLGAELVESVDPLYPDDPGVPNMNYTFQDAIAEILRTTCRNISGRTTDSGELEFAVPGWDVRTVDYAVALALHKAPLSDKINLRSISDRLGESGESIRHQPVSARARRCAGQGLGELGGQREVQDRCRSGHEP